MADDAFPMIDDVAMPEGAVNLGDVLIWPAPGAERRFHFLPFAPAIARNPDGSDQVSLIDVGDMAFFQLATHWSVPEARLEAIRADIEAVIEDAPVLLSFAPIEDVRAELFVGEGDAPLASAATSGMPPYAAMFSQQLEGDAKATVEAGLAGQRGRITVRYHAMLALSQSAEIAFSGELGSDVSVAALRTALDEGRAAFDGAETTQTQRDALIDQAITLLTSTEQPDASGRFSLMLSRAGRRFEPVHVAADLGAGRAAEDLFDALLPSALGPP